MDHDPKVLKQIVEEILIELKIDYRFRPMFGGFGVYAENVIFSTLSNVGIGLKLSSADHAELCTLGGVGLAYEPGSKPSKTYAVPPEDWLSKKENLTEWINRSVRFVLKS